MGAIKWIFTVFVLVCVYGLAFIGLFKLADKLDRKHDWWEIVSKEPLALAVFLGLLAVGLGIALSGVSP